MKRETTGVSATGSTAFGKLARYLCMLVACLYFTGIAEGKLPNIVVFISDDLGRLETSIYGSKEINTPMMDRLAERGMVFDNAYVASPSCCPNRYSLLTGLMPARHGAHPNHSLPKPGTQFLLPVLQKMGYYVASFGKVAHGRIKMKGTDFHSPPPRQMSKQVIKHFAETDVDGPVCLLVGDRRPHVPWTKEMIYDPAKVTLPAHFIDTPETREHWARYLTDISGMDQEMTRIHDFARHKFGDDFIFLFTSDHGGQWPFGKWNLYDSGARVPLVCVWPDHIPAGQRSSAMVSWVDLIPTLIDLAGGTVPDGIDGESFANVLLGVNAMHRDAIFTTHTGDGGMNIFPIRSVRVGRFKYIHNLRPEAYHTNHSDRLRKDGAGAFWDSWDEVAKRDPAAKAVVDSYYTRDEFELFDLDSDPHELNNLADNSDYAKTRDMLRARLAEWTTSQGDDLAPHREPYPVSESLPELKPKPKRKATSAKR